MVCQQTGALGGRRKPPVRCNVPCAAGCQRTAHRHETRPWHHSHLLLTEYAPACLYLGTLVRQCHWVLRQPGSGVHAQQALQTALLLLLRLLGDEAHKEEYVRSLAVALTLWSHWHSAIPGCCYSEEPNEAALSRLGESCQRHPQAISTEDVKNLYVLVRPGRMGYKDLRPGKISAAWQQQVHDNLNHFVQTQGVYARWMPHVGGVGAITQAQHNLPDNNPFPQSLHVVPNQATLTSSTRKCRGWCTPLL